ncbi:hypothetical protein OIU79_019610 [Salix purpurea]|uniref:Uncharacterized protein n=1 Tax=Salix purpurea TaxID=77065 RepID=A0A9Q0SJP0_SALPP|nr:hypothetical protein OIU79_019610 [Salix purpurea]
MSVFILTDDTGIEVIRHKHQIEGDEESHQSTAQVDVGASSGVIPSSEKIRDLPSSSEMLAGQSVIWLGDAVDVKKDAETGITAEKLLDLVG